MSLFHRSQVTCELNNCRVPQLNECLTMLLPIPNVDFQRAFLYSQFQSVVMPLVEKRRRQKFQYKEEVVGTMK